jgi:hypothetical protein
MTSFRCSAALRATALVVGLAFAFAPMRVSASVTLISQDYYTGSGSHVIDKPPPANDGLDILIPTAYTHSSFPGAGTSVAIDPSGKLTIASTISGNIFHQSTASNLYNLNTSWTVHGFDIVFSVDSPSAFSYSSGGFSQSVFIGKEQITLKGDSNGFIGLGGPPAIPGSASGTLLPDTYTLHVDTGTNGPDDGLPTVTNTLSNLFLSVTPTPEPASVAMLLAPALLSMRARRRRRRRV